MKITGIEIKQYAKPLDPPFLASWDPNPRVKFASTIVYVYTDEGITGIGSGDLMTGFAGHEKFFIGKDPFEMENHNKIIDQAARIFSILGYSFPTFVFGLLVLMIFYARLGWFPPGRLSTEFSQVILQPEYSQYTKLVTIDALLNGRFDIFLDALRHMVLPIITLSYLSWALLLKVTRSSMLESLRQDFVTTARSKGLSERAVINQHVRPNALIPVTTISAAVVAGLLNGVVITETIFNYPGLGSAAAAAAVSLDVLTMLGFALFNGILFVGIFLVVDVLYGLLDPRIRLT